MYVQVNKVGVPRSGCHASHLQADDVGVAAVDLLHDALLAVLPAERPRGAVGVQLPRGILVAQHVVAHDGEGG